jgi:hypothetical protein
MPGQALLSVRQSPLVHGRFSFQDEVDSQGRQPESFTESEAAPPWRTSGPLVWSHAGRYPSLLAALVWSHHNPVGAPPGR